MISMSYLKYFALNLITIFLWAIVGRYAYLLEYNFACITGFTMAIINAVFLGLETIEFIEEIRKFIEEYDIQEIEDEEEDKE